MSDGAESNSGTFVDAGDTGTDPTVADTDGDGVDDFTEVCNGSDPTDITSFLPAGLAAVRLTDDAGSGIDAGSAAYLHWPR